MLQRIGYDEGWAVEAARWAASDATVGRVVRVDRGAASVLAEDGPHRATYGADLLRRMAEDPLDTPSTGDWVVVRDWPDHRTTVEAVLPRRTALVRRTAGEQSHGQVLCANADRAVIVTALHPDPALAKLERLVAVAWESGAEPLIVLTKADLVGDAPAVATEIAADAPGVEVAVTSVVTGVGIARLLEIIDGRHTLALVGSSGHGKSSLVNALVGAEVLTTKRIRDDGRGRHTSVRRELVVLPTGGAVIDTPGLRGVGLVDTERGVARAFADIEALAASCRFNDCAHLGEPGCAVDAAIETGVLPQRRLDAFLKLQRELDWIASRTDARLRAERVREWKRRTREAGRTRT